MSSYTEKVYKEHQAKLVVGSKVCYTAMFCRSIGAYTGHIPFAVGTIVAHDHDMGDRFVSVRWDDTFYRDNDVHLVNRYNLWDATKKYTEPN